MNTLPHRVKTSCCQTFVEANRVGVLGRRPGLIVSALVLFALLFSPACVTAQSSVTQQTSHSWPTYYGNDAAWAYSPLDQINRDNVRLLKAAWVHQPGVIEGGLYGTPLAVDVEFDGTMRTVIYYTSSWNRVFALDGTTGETIWYYYPDYTSGFQALDEGSWGPFNRGPAIGHGMVYQGMVDGSVIALDMKTGDLVWKTYLINVVTCNCEITGAPLIVGDLVVIGQTSGEVPSPLGSATTIGSQTQIPKLFALDASTGEVAWEFDTLDPASWGKDSWKRGGGGAWMTGSYDPDLNLLYWGTSNPNPDYDLESSDPDALRPGDNLYTSSIVVLNPDRRTFSGRNPHTGVPQKQPVAHFQEFPHDSWDWDGAVGQKMLIDRGDEKYLLHWSKGGYQFIYDRTDMRCITAYPLLHNINYVDGIDPRTCQLINPHYPQKPPPGQTMGPTFTQCPWNVGGHSWNPSTYNPSNGMVYHHGMEACTTMNFEFELDVTQIPPDFRWGVVNQKQVNPPGDSAHSHFDAFRLDDLLAFRPTPAKPMPDPVWSIRFRIPPLGGTLSTGGGLVFLADFTGLVLAYNADTGDELWRFRTGSVARGGIITYGAVDGKQYVAAMVGGSRGGYPDIWPETADIPNGAALFVFTLPDGME